MTKFHENLLQNLIQLTAISVPREVASVATAIDLTVATLATSRGTDSVEASARTPLYSEGSRNRKFSPRRPFYISRSLWRLSSRTPDQCFPQKIQRSSA